MYRGGVGGKQSLKDPHPSEVQGLKKMAQYLIHFPNVVSWHH